MTDEIKKLMLVNYGYPKTDDPTFLEQIYKKREFYGHIIQPRPDINDYDAVKKYRDAICSGKAGLYEHQAMLSNFINPDTPYRGLLLFHGLGTGKCISGTSLVYVNGLLLKIQDIWNIYKTDIIYDVEGCWSKPSMELHVNSYDKNKIIKKEVNMLYREKINQKIKKIELENGSVISITNSHKLLTKNGWTNNFSVDDFVCVPNIIRNFSESYNVFSQDDAILFGYLFNNTKQKTYFDDVYHELFFKYEKQEIIYNIIKKLKIEIIEKKTKSVILNLNRFKFSSIDDNILCNLLNSQESIIKIFIRTFILNNNNNQSDIVIKSSLKNKLFIPSFLLLCKISHVTDLVIKDGNIIMQASSINNFLNNILNDEITFIKIKKIEELLHDDYVYDLEIQDTHCYVAENIVCHNTCAAIAIAEQFKNMVNKYGTKIYVLVPGPAIKENWKKELIICTGNEYMKGLNTKYLSKEELEKGRKNAVISALQYYRFISYRSFYKRVIGEKITDKVLSEDDKVKAIYRKTEEGEFAREYSVDRIYNLNNSLIIVEEAHGLTNNSYGEALAYIIKNSENLKVILLSATPMKNSAVDIVELLNYIRPQDSQIERDKIFTQDRVHLIDLKEGGLEYLKKMSKGYVSRVKGNDPLTFARKVNMGEKPKEFRFIKIIRCYMSDFHREIYDITLKENQDDVLDRKLGAVANFVFPGFDQDSTSLTGYYAKDGSNIVKNQLRQNKEKLNKKIIKDLLNGEEVEDFMYINANDVITGKIYSIKYLKQFSTKFYQAMMNLNNLVYGKEGPKTSFVYCNLVKHGIEIFQQVLLQNGYLEYDENQNYVIYPHTVCYFCGREYQNHTDKSIPAHTFHPATFVTFTGKTDDEIAETIPEDKQRIIDDAFNIIENKNGKIIKILLGSKVMNEGITLKQVGQIHILDVYFNLTKVDQTEGRGIRTCSHYKLMDINNKFPEVKVYKYATSLQEGVLSAEEELYQNAEAKYILIKKVERALSECAVDCPLNMNGNIFKEEVEKYKDCETNPNNPCPPECDFTSCEYKCDDVLFNAKYYDPNSKMYKKLSKADLDYSTFSNSLARHEIDFSKKKIKEMYLNNYVYTIDKIIEYVKKYQSESKLELFDKFFVYRALDELIPLSENDFNNFSDIIYDKFSRPGYLIYVDNFYIYQPFDQKTDVPMYYRVNYDKVLYGNISIKNFIKNTDEYKEYIKHNQKKIDKNKKVVTTYDFDSVLDYYDARQENKYVGIIDREYGIKKNITAEDLADVFKIREKRPKILLSKRGTGIQTLKGSVCFNSKTKEYLEILSKKLEIDSEKTDNRVSLCDKIKDKMLYLEKYAEGKDKKTYVIIPANHDVYPFPYNLEDRIEFTKKKINDKLNFNVDFDVDKKMIKNLPTYKIKIKNSSKIEPSSNFLTALGFKLLNGSWIVEYN